jgi:hypothetical protein
MGGVTAPAPEYVRAVVRIAVRCRKPDGQCGYGVLIGPPDLGPIWALLAHTGPLPRDKAGRLLAYVQAYDQRGGGVETAFKDDKQGLGHIVQIILNQAAPLVRGLVVAFQALLAPAHIAITLGET